MSSKKEKTFIVKCCTPQEDVYIKVNSKKHKNLLLQKNCELCSEKEFEYAQKSEQPTSVLHIDKTKFDDFYQTFDERFPYRQMSLFHTKTKKKNRRTKEWMQNEITHLFKDYLMDQDITDNNLTITYYWDYNDTLSSQALMDIFNVGKKDQLSLEDAILNYLYAQDWCVELYESLFPVNQTVYDFINEMIHSDEEIKHKEIIPYIMKHKEGLIEYLDDWVHNAVTIDLNVNDLITNTIPEDTVLYFGTNWEDAYLNETIWTDLNDAIWKDELNRDEIDTDEAFEDSMVAWLIQTQGYQPMDIFNQRKRQHSKFLSTLYSELFGYLTDLHGLQLIALPETTDLHVLYGIYCEQPFRIDKTVPFGLFNHIHGTGTGLQIDLDRDIECDNEQLYRMDLALHDDYDDYSPDAVYGLIRDHSHQDLHILK